MANLKMAKRGNWAELFVYDATRKGISKITALGEEIRRKLRKWIKYMNLI